MTEPSHPDIAASTAYAGGQQVADAEVAIVGGGVMGLWVRALLASRNVSTLLFEQALPGAMQTIASQGILHAGVKYALGGEKTRAAAAVESAQPVWTSCLTGQGVPDLSGVQIASEQMVLWTTTDIRSKLAATGAARAMRSHVSKQERSFGTGVVCDALHGASENIHWYTVDERVVKTDSLVRELVRSSTDPVLSHTRVNRIESVDAHDIRWRLTYQADRGRAVTNAKYLVLAAGEGNEALLVSIGMKSTPRMQTRPLHMVMLRNAPCILFGHCLRLSAVPRLTVTTSHAKDGSLVWWIGGQIAETGVNRDVGAQCDFARDELHACLPWLDFSDAMLSAFTINRAEGVSGSGGRPDSFVTYHTTGLSVVWPTKLVLAPVAGAGIVDRIAETVRSSGMVRSHGPEVSCDVATYPWDSGSLTWK